MIIVVGTGRCGTSAIAGVLFYLGVNMGERFFAPDSGNPLGYWEDFDVTGLDVSYMSGDIPFSKWKEGYHTLMGRRTEPWGFKTPTTAAVVDKLADIFPGAHYIHCNRPVNEILDSIKRMHKKKYPKGHFEKLIARIEKAKKYGKWLTIDFKELKDREKTVDRIIEFTGLKPTEKQRQRAILHLIPEKDFNNVRIVDSSLFL